MSEIDKKPALMTLTVNGQKISAPPAHSVIQALWYAGVPRIQGVACLEGVCGSCRILVRRADSSEVSIELACQAPIKEGMQVIFPPFPDVPNHHYQLSDFSNSRELKSHFQRIFPEASQCRSCGGCTVACPKEIHVEQGVHLASAGKFREAGDLFIECVMCDACITACPEFIAPNHVGLFSRRVTAYFHLQPNNLITRLEQLRQSHLSVVKPETTNPPST